MRPRGTNAGLQQRGIDRPEMVAAGKNLAILSWGLFQYTLWFKTTEQALGSSLCVLQLFAHNCSIGGVLKTFRQVLEMIKAKVNTGSSSPKPPHKLLKVPFITCCIVLAAASGVFWKDNALFLTFIAEDEYQDCRNLYVENAENDAVLYAHFKFPNWFSYIMLELLLDNNDNNSYEYSLFSALMSCTTL